MAVLIYVALRYYFLETKKHLIFHCKNFHANISLHFPSLHKKNNFDFWTEIVSQLQKFLLTNFLEHDP